MKKNFILIAGCIILFACNNPKGAKEAREEAKDTAANASPVIIPDNDKVVQQADSTIRFVQQAGMDSLVGKGRLEKNGDPVICYVDLEKGKKIIGTIIPDKAGANIRFSHIYMPDGSSDGPFSQTIEYPINQTGTYRLFISPNRMAGDPINTDFTIVLKLK